MFSGFNVKLDKKTIDGDYYYEIGDEIAEENKDTVHKNLKKYIYENDSLSGSQIETDWFPEIEADIFLSHSHADEDLVISFSGWLYEIFGLRTFIDSMVWGHSNDLLRKIDNRYCLKTPRSYSYEKRNFSTSHVHMMLSVALTKMIDKCESVFFVNTPNSITVSKNIKAADYTFSPWIYAEIEMTRMIRRKKLSEYRPMGKMVHDSKYALNENLRIHYDISLDHLIELSNDDLSTWEERVRKSACAQPMDELYRITRIWGGNVNG